MSQANLQVTISAGRDSLQRFIDSMNRLRDAFIQVGTLLGIPDPRAERIYRRIYRRKQTELRSHVMRMNAGNRRRQMRSRGGVL